MRILQNTFYWSHDGPICPTRISSSVQTRDRSIKFYLRPLRFIINYLFIVSNFNINDIEICLQFWMEMMDGNGKRSNFSIKIIKGKHKNKKLIIKFLKQNKWHTNEIFSSTKTKRIIHLQIASFSLFLFYIYEIKKKNISLGIDLLSLLFYVIASMLVPVTIAIFTTQSLCLFLTIIVYIEYRLEIFCRQKSKQNNE